MDGGEARNSATFGARLKLLRRRKKMSMDELAVATGTTKSAISRYENNLVMPTLDTAKKFAEYFMVTLDWIGGGGDENEIISAIPHAFIEAVKYAMEHNVSAQQLVSAVDLIKGGN